MGNRSSAGYEPIQNRESNEINQRIDELTMRILELESNFRIINLTACSEEKCSSYAKYCSLKEDCERNRVIVNKTNEENFRLQTEKKNFCQG